MANADLLSEVTGTATWHINSDEPDILDYDTTFKKPAQDALYEANAFRASDHDPVIVGLNLNSDTEVLLDALESAIMQLQADGVLNKGQANALLSKLKQVRKSIEKGKNNTASNQLKALRNQISDFVSDGILSTEQGNHLDNLAEIILNLL